jgi:hypothetical protein
MRPAGARQQDQDWCARSRLTVCWSGRRGPSRRVRPSTASGSCVMRT